MVPHILSEVEISAIELAVIPSKDRRDAGYSFEDIYTVVNWKTAIPNLIVTARHWKNQFDILDEECIRLEKLEVLIEQLKVESEMLRGSLRFYANPESYNGHDHAPIIYDDGDRARQALGLSENEESEHASKDMHSPMESHS